MTDILMVKNIVYCGTRAGLFQKVENTPWEFVGMEDLAVREIANNDQYLYSCGYYGCYRLNFKSNEIQQIKIGSIQTVATTDSIVFIGSGNYPGIYKSTDFGETWVESKNGLDNYDIEKIFITKSNIVLASAAGASGSAVFRSTDFGETWSRVDPYQFAWNFHGICENNGKLYAFDYKNYAEVYVSIDDGLTWQKKNAPADQIYDVFINNNGLYAATTRTGVFRSLDDGYSWSKINEGLSNLDIVSLGGNDTTVFAGGFGGIYTTKNLYSWENVSNGFSNSQVNSIIRVNDRLFAATHGVGIFCSLDEGATWDKLQSNLKEPYIHDIAYIDNSMYIVASNNWLSPFGSKIYKSTDFGLSWIRGGAGFDTGLLEKIVGNEHFILVGSQYGLFKSINGGDTWVKIIKGINYNMNISDIAVLDSTAVLVNGTSEVFYSTDFGENWNSYHLPDLFRGLTVQVINEDYYIGAGSVSQLFKSSDFGKTFTRILSFPARNANVQSISGYDNSLYATLSKGGICFSADSADRWQFLNRNFCVENINHIYNQGRCLLAGTLGGGVLKFIFSDTPIKFNSPLDDTVNFNQILFDWNPHNAADKYRFQFSLNGNFDHVLLDSIVDNTSIKVKNLLYGHTNYYRISTVNESWADDFLF